VLITAVVLAVLGGSWVFALLILVGALTALHEWHRLVNGGSAALEAVPAALTMIVVVGLVLTDSALLLSLAVLVLGAGTAALVAVKRGSWALWHAVGVVYIGVAVLALMMMREGQISSGIVDGRVIVGGVFTAVWAADTGALFFGRMLGGPRLAPQLSPKKTWAGFIGGIFLAGIAEFVYVAIIDGPLWLGISFGICLGVTSSCGDLFESWVKRVFQTKNSGDLIPGHGGMLDRVDSLLFAAPAGAAVLFIFGDVSPFGINP
jgi:phosphatidate cytidylyltransferase